MFNEKQTFFGKKFALENTEFYGLTGGKAKNKKRLRKGTKK